MNINKKIIAVFLILPVLAVNMPLMAHYSCPMKNNSAKKMTCCSHKPNGEISFEATCCCEITNRTEAAASSVNLFENKKESEQKNLSSKKIQKDELNFEESSKQNSIQKFEFLYHPKIISDQNIYDFISSYLI